MILAGAFALGQKLPSESERLVAVGKLWVTVEYFHPAVANPKFDWDRALVAALPSIRSADTIDRYRSSVAALLRDLPEEQHSLPQRTWVHLDLEHTAFLSQDGTVTAQPFDIGGGVLFRVQLSEPAVNPIGPAAPEHAYSSDSYPNTEMRILAAYKLWGTVHYFFAYRDLMDIDWDDEFPKFLQSFIDAKDAREYHLAVEQALTKLDDSQSQAVSPVLDDYFGMATPPLCLRLVDKKPLVSEILGDNAGVQVGDIVLKVDGEDIVKRIDREAALLPASTHQALSELVMRRILNGPIGSEAVVTLRHHDGSETEVRLKRSGDFSKDDSPVVKQLSGKAGYIDLTRLARGMIDEVFSRVAGKEALLLDARGDLSFDARLLAGKLNSKPDVAAAIVSGPLLLQPDLPKESSVTDSNSFFSVESAPASPNAFKGHVVMLIDGRTIGEAEHLGLLLEAAQKIAFVGTDSAGACGKVSHFMLPGGLRVSISASDVRHANTGKLQRVGLLPTVVAAPELADVRAGRDVAIEKALEYLAAK